MQPSFARYLLVFAGSLLSVVLLVWGWVVAEPMAFMESGYAAWAAKSTMLRECRLGQIAFFGDSRLEAGVVPAALPVEASNFGLASATAIEVRTGVDRAALCPAPPRQAVLTLVPEHFGPVSDFFWLLSLRYGWLSFDDLRTTERLADQLGDTTTLATRTPDGLGGPVRDWLYAIRFPSLSFSSLVQGRVAGRLGTNTERYTQTLQARGWGEYTPRNFVRVEPAEAFTPTRLQTAEFEAAIDRLRDRGVEVFLLVMPFAQSNQESADVISGYERYLASVARRDPGVHLLADGVPVWPDRLFADGSHLDGAGARAFTDRLAACMTDGRLAPPCDLRWRPDTAAAAQTGSAVLEVQQQSNRQH